MFATMKQIFKSENKDLRRRIYFTLFCLFIFKLGTTIIVPGVDAKLLGSNLGFLELINAMGGGALEKFSIFALGVMPYITASIIIQLLQMDIVPYLTELSKQGQVGRNKINQITRVTGIILAFIQGYLFSFAFIQNGTPLQYMEFALILTAGTAFLLWIGDQITKKGVGNGTSLIIMAGIIATMPSMFVDAYNGFVTGGDLQQTLFGITKFILFVAMYLAIVIAVVFEQSAERRIPIQYANQSGAGIGGNKSYIPFKLNSASVIPVIFASAIISVPGLIAQLLKNESMTLFVQKWLSFQTGTGFVLYIVLIIAFTYFYTYLQLKPKELAENLQKNGGYIPGVHPGDDTVKYISKTLNRITLVGALCLAVIAGLPIVFGMFSNLPTSVSIGGTGLLIVVGVALETYRQVESKLISRNYTSSRGRRRRR